MSKSQAGRCQHKLTGALGYLLRPSRNRRNEGGSWPKATASKQANDRFTATKRILRLTGFGRFQPFAIGKSATVIMSNTLITVHRN